MARDKLQFQTVKKYLHDDANRSMMIILMALMAKEWPVFNPKPRNP